MESLKEGGGERRPFTIAIIGAGNRGFYTYGAFALKNPDKFKVVAVADPNPEKRERMAKTHNIPKDKTFDSWESFFKAPKLADAVVIATGDNQHIDPAIEAMRKGYHILLEKPIAQRPPEFARLHREYQKHKDEVVVIVAHVLRYTPFFRRIKQIISSGKIGRTVGIEHEEHVGYYHFAHSFVRGNWRRTDETAPTILTKCCHDMDIMIWLVGSKMTSVSAYGGLVFFRRENKPPEAAERCLDCRFKDTCPYSAVKLYLGDYTGWPVNAISVDLSYEARYKAIKEGPYGRCVFACDNDVCDHYAVSMKFENGVLGTFTMTGFSYEITRKTRVFGTLGEIEGDLKSGKILVKIYGKGMEEHTEIGEGGHCGGDIGLMNHFYRVLAGEENPETTLDDSLESHYIAFAVEESRLSGGKPVNVPAFRGKFEGE